MRFWSFLQQYFLFRWLFGSRQSRQPVAAAGSDHAHFDYLPEDRYDQPSVGRPSAERSTHQEADSQDHEERANDDGIEEPDEIEELDAMGELDDEDAADELEDELDELEDELQDRLDELEDELDELEEYEEFRDEMDCYGDDDY